MSSAGCKHELFVRIFLRVVRIRTRAMSSRPTISSMNASVPKHGTVIGLSQRVINEYSAEVPDIADVDAQTRVDMERHPVQGDGASRPQFH